MTKYLIRIEIELYADTAEKAAVALADRAIWETK